MEVQPLGDALRIIREVLDEQGLTGFATIAWFHETKRQWLMEHPQRGPSVEYPEAEMKVEGIMLKAIRDEMEQLKGELGA